MTTQKIEFEKSVVFRNDDQMIVEHGITQRCYLIRLPWYGRLLKRFGHWLIDLSRHTEKLTEIAIKK